MAICANCSTEALYTYVINENYKINYCQYHLPNFLTARKIAGQLPLIEDAAPVVETPAPKSKKAAATTTDAPVDAATDATN
jgi:hypothetical protein